MIRHFVAQGTEAGLDFDVRFDSERRFHCLVGVNGVGKTHLIEHIARTLIFAHAMFGPGLGLHHRFERAFARASVFAAIGSLKMTMARDITIDEHTVKSPLLYPWQLTTLEALDRTRADNFCELLFDAPFVFVGARERGHTRNIERSQLRLLGGDVDRFVEAFKKTWRAATGELVETEEPAEWFASRLLVNPAFAVGNENDANAVVEVLRLLAELEPEEFGALIVEGPSPGESRVGLTYVDGALLFAGRPIDKLATGYIAVLKIFQEIIAGYSGWAAMLPKGSVQSLRELDGVVFIDEIEAHLHPQWQAHIVGVLKRAFPNTSFFVTTHSPLIVRQTEPGEAVEILRDGNRVTSRSLGSPRDWYLADVLAEGFHVEVPLPGQDAPEGERPLGDVMIDFSHAVREFTAARDTKAREAALVLHQEIDARLAPEDPRRRSLGMLRGLLG